MLAKMEDLIMFSNTNRLWFGIFSNFSVVRPGDEILVADPVYFPTRLLTKDFLKILT